MVEVECRRTRKLLEMVIFTYVRNILELLHNKWSLLHVFGIPPKENS